MDTPADVALITVGAAIGASGPIPACRACAWMAGNRTRENGIVIELGRPAGNSYQTVEVDTVVVAFTDLPVRLRGSGAARFSLDEVLSNTSEACDTSSRVDVGSKHGRLGFDMSSWKRGYGDLCVLHAVWRRCGCLPWKQGSVLVLADLKWAGSDRPVTPRPGSSSRRRPNDWPRAGGPDGRHRMEFESTATREDGGTGYRE